MIFRWSVIIDAITAYFTKRTERKPNDLAPECKSNQRVKFRSEIWDGNKHSSIF